MSLPPDFTNDLRKRFAGQIRTDLASRILYSTDASIYQMEPRGVVIPRTQDDLQAAVELAAKYRIPILPRGAGTSLAGQAIGDALILDCSRWLDSIVEIDPEAMRGAHMTFGSGRFADFFRTFRSDRLGRFRAFATDHDRAVVLRFADHTVVVTPADPAGLAASLRRSIGSRARAAQD